MSHQNHRRTERPVTTLFLDIGGVLLANGWGHQSRKLAADTSGMTHLL